MANNWEYVYNGLTVGGATPYGITLVDGFSDMADIRADISDKVGRHGGFTFMDRYGVRRVVLQGDMTAATQAAFEGQVTSLKTAFAAQASPLPLVFKRPGLGGSGQHRLYCKPSKLAIPFTTDFAIGYSPWAAELVAEDPFFYDDTATTPTITGATGGTASMTNSGNVPLLFENVRVTGPGTTFTIRINADPVNAVVIAHTLGAGAYIDVDFQDRTVIDNTGTSQYGKVTQASTKWWELPVGTTTVQFIVGSGGSAATNAAFTFRNAWN
jgi:hypothetical protein